MWLTNNDFWNSLRRFRARDKILISQTGYAITKKTFPNGIGKNSGMYNRTWQQYETNLLKSRWVISLMKPRGKNRSSWIGITKPSSMKKFSGDRDPE